MEGRWPQCLRVIGIPSRAKNSEATLVQFYFSSTFNAQRGPTEKTDEMGARGKVIFQY